MAGEQFADILIKVIFLLILTGAIAGLSNAIYKQSKRYREDHLDH
jgi:hypothetical protein